ncbi:MAG: Asp-tRNA(Asn)/Glu-tRNA(Gln) amidotransferase subunit GatC [Patescibacteria group bacterium]|nr:Asp-tRNA(Asn)/Glu-tRNA(Gln) amidotransferase subunit GatC [Patescibacteria group bacterium]
MTKITKTLNLARINVSPQEERKLDSVFEYMEVLNEVDTEGVEPTSQVTGLQDVMREDEIDESICSGDDLLACSPLEVENRQIKVRKVL